MPDGTPTSAPGGQPSPGQPQQPQAPFGGTSAMGPTPNRGHEAAGMQKLGMTIKMLEQIIPLVGSTSEAGKAILDSIKKFSKFVPSGSVSPAGQRNQLEQMALQQGQQNQQMQALKAQQQQKPGGAPGAQPPQAAAA